MGFQPSSCRRHRIVTANAIAKIDRPMIRPVATKLGGTNPTSDNLSGSSHTMSSNPSGAMQWGPTQPFLHSHTFPFVQEPRSSPPHDSGDTPSARRSQAPRPTWMGFNGLSSFSVLYNFSWASMYRLVGRSGVEQPTFCSGLVGSWYTRTQSILYCGESRWVIISQKPSENPQSWE
jgi:hypothetical protein